MANVICVMGESGSGKTTSMRNLDPSSTYYFDCDKKGLSWRGWKSTFNTKAKNYAKIDDPEAIISILTGINEKSEHIKTIVIDTINGIMVADEMRRMNEKGYDKWIDLATSVYNLIDYALTMRDDMTVIFIAHIQVDDDENGYKLIHIKTNGKKLNKIGLETKFPIVLLSKCINGEYIFETQANNSTAKSPMGMIDKLQIPNDITTVIKDLEEYYA